MAIIIFFVLLIAYGAGCTQLFDNSTIPGNLTAACTAALLADVNCSSTLIALQIGLYYPDPTLQRICTSDCEAALAVYESNIITSCVEDSWNGYEDTPMPLGVIPGTLRYQYNLTCLMDSGRYCNTVAAQAAAINDPEAGDPITGGAVSPGVAANPCDMCFIKNLQFQAGSPYFDGPQLAQSSLYESKTSSCSVVGMPLTTTALQFFTTIAPATPTFTCSGKIYEIQPGDDCYSISKSQGIGTGWLLTDNTLSAYCADFPTTGKLCLLNTCQTYTVQQNDTCKSIAQSVNVTISQLQAWNMVINAGCNNIAFLIGSEICITAPGQPYSYPTVSSALAPSIASTPTPVPTDIANSTNKYCGRYYFVVLGDYCNLVCLKFGISLSDFVFLNPSINENCTNLFANESYCVQPVGDINTYSGRAGYSATPVASIQGTQIFSTLPLATYTPLAFPPSFPIAPGSRADCSTYFNGSMFNNINLTLTFYKSICEFAADVFAVPPVDFAFWNPGLGNLSDPNCTFATGVQYCRQWYDDSPVGTPIQTATFPVRDGASPNCTEFAAVSDLDTCQSILDEYQLTIAQFFAYNPAVGSTCGNLWLNYQYCVRTPDYRPPATASVLAGSNPTSTMPSVSATSPVQSGQPGNCNAWYSPLSEDSCDSVENQFFITDTQFHQWNPALLANCSGLWFGYDYCVNVTTNTIGRSSLAAASTTTSTSSGPTPTQANNIVSNCNKWAQTIKDDSCSAFAQRNGIATEQLYAWNALLGSDGSGCASELWALYYYCVGVSN